MIRKFIDRLLGKAPAGDVTPEGIPLGQRVEYGTGVADQELLNRQRPGAVQRIDVDLDDGLAGRVDQRRDVRAGQNRQWIEILIGLGADFNGVSEPIKSGQDRGDR